MGPRSTVKEGDDLHIKGFILNKLYTGRYFAGSGGGHGRHTSVKNLPKGYEPKYRGKFKKMTNRLKSDGLIHIFKSVGEDHACANLDPDSINAGLPMCNAYREAVGLPPLDKTLNVIPGWKPPI